MRVCNTHSSRTASAASASAVAVAVLEECSSAWVRALASVLGNAVPIFATCDPRDFYAVPMVRAPHDQLPTIYLYDRYPGGIGLARKVFSIDRDIVRAARGIAGDCKCARGCPSCVGPAVEVGEGGKKTAAFLLERLEAQLAGS